MMRRGCLRWGFLGLGLLAFCLFVGIVASAPKSPISHKALTPLRISAYQGWQSTGVTLEPGEQFIIRARGKWMYTPHGGFHGPEGHPRFRAPDFYPLPQVPGGALIGKIGEQGKPFYVGAKFFGTTAEGGMLYLRINDDILSDNEGFVEVEIEVHSPTPSE